MDAVPDDDDAYWNNPFMDRHGYADAEHVWPTASTSMGILLSCGSVCYFMDPYTEAVEMVR